MFGPRFVSSFSLLGNFSLLAFERERADVASWRAVAGSLREGGAEENVESELSECTTVLLKTDPCFPFFCVRVIPSELVLPLP